MSFCHYKKKKKKKKRESESDFYSNLKSEKESRQSRGNKKVQKIDSIDATNSVCLFAWVLGFMHEFDKIIFDKTVQREIRIYFIIFS